MKFNQVAFLLIFFIEYILSKLGYADIVVFTIITSLTILAAMFMIMKSDYELYNSKFKLNRIVYGFENVLTLQEEYADAGYIVNYIDDNRRGKYFLSFSFKESN